MGTVDSSPMEKPRPSGRWAAIVRLIAAATATAMVGGIESRRSDSVLPSIDDHLLVTLQKFLPPGRNGPLVLEAKPDADTRVFAPAPDASPLPVPVCRYEKADESILVEWPPGPVDLAMAVETLAAAKSLSLAWAPDWQAPADGTLAFRAFANARSQTKALPFLHAYWPGYSAAPEENAPALLALPPALDTARVRGDLRKIPEINDPGPWPPESTGLAPCDAGFGRLLLLAPLAAPPGRVAMPMLARSGDRILPSLALLAFVRANHLNLSEVDVHLGSAILAEKTAIPVDDRGCLLLPVSFAKRVPVFSALAEDAGPPAQGKNAILSFEGLPAQSGTTEDVGIWTAAALGAIEAGDFALPIRVLHRAPADVATGVAVLLVFGAVVSLWLPGWQRLWVAAAMFAALAVATRHTANAHGQFIGLTLPLLVWLVATLMALRFSPQPAPTPVPLPPASEPAPPALETAPPDEAGAPSPPAAMELDLADPRRPADRGKKKPKSGKRRRKG